MKRKELISMTDEYEFRETLSRAKLSDDEKVCLIRERQEYMYSNGILKTAKRIGHYRDPLTGLIRFNVGR